MPHPEAFNHPSNHPDWPRSRQASVRKLPGSGITKTGIVLFENAVQYFSG